MEILVRSIKVRRWGGGETLVDEFWDMVDHSARRDGSNWLPGPRRFALRTGETVRRLDEVAFQVTATAEVLTAIREVSLFDA